MIDHSELRSRSICRPVLSLLFSILAVFSLGNVLAAGSPRERVLMDSGWQFHLGDPPDVGNQFDYPEIKDLAKTREGTWKGRRDEEVKLNRYDDDIEN